MKLVIGGATGFVGAETLRQALALDDVTSIVTIARRSVLVPEGSDRSKLQEITLNDFLHYPDSAKRLLADADACIWTVALTPFKAVSYQWEEVKKVCADYALAAFNTMVEARTTNTKLRFIYYSGIGTERDQQRTLFLPLPGYARMRGQAESDLLKGASESNGRVEVCVAKPAIVLGPNFIGRGPLDMVSKAIGLPSIKLEDCAAATLKQCVEGIEQQTLENGDMQQIGSAYLPVGSTRLCYWMNVGIGISSRLAEETLQHIDSIREATPGSPYLPAGATAAHGLLQERIARLLNRSVAHQKQVAPSDVYLYASGVGAIYQVHKYFQLGQDPAESTVLFGFAFLATAYTLNDFGASYKFLGSANCDELESFAREEEKQGRRIRAVWTEFPANPLLFVPDLSRLRSLADRYGFVLVVDETIGSFCNVDVMGPRGGDLIVTSLTKSFNGYSDIMAGGAVLNSCSNRYEELKKLFVDTYRNEFFAGDAETLESNSRDYLSRSTTLNHNARALADFFSSRAADKSSAIQQVYYPTETQRDRTTRLACGIQAKSSHRVATRIHIGPQLGAHVTIALAYVKLLYGANLEEVLEFGLNERQVRISAELEPIEELIPVFKAALEVAENYEG